MIKTLLAFLLLVIVNAAPAQYVARRPAVVAIPQSPDYNMPAGKIYINQATIPKRRFGFSSIRLFISCGPTADPIANCGGIQSSDFPQQKPGNIEGSFRIKCQSSHWTFDDPIVKPRRAGETHLHQFFGNTTTDAQSDPAQMATVGNSTCAGGIANRTGYWVPVVVYHCPAGEVGCTRSRDGEVFAANENNAYYKTSGVSQAKMTSLVWFPAGLRIIAGDPNNTDPARMQGRFDCTTNGVLSNQWDHIPTTDDIPAGCADLNMLVNFPTCWDGVNLYLPTSVGGVFSAHMANRSGAACDDPAFPVIFPFIGYNIHTAVPNSADLSYLRLSSDLPATNGTMRSGSTTTAVVLASAEPATTNYYQFGYVTVNGQRRRITAYNGTTKVATVSPGFTTAPVSGATYLIRTAAGRSLHGDWANGWDQTANFLGWGRTLPAQIIRGCYVDVARYGSVNMTFDCHDNNVGSPQTGADPGDPTNAYWMLF